MKITNIKNLGNPYYVVDDDGNRAQVIVVEKEDLLMELALPDFNPNEQSYIDYLANCRARVRGNDFKYNEILWYRTTFEDYDLHEVFVLCLYCNYNYVIVDLALTQDAH
jgi:hypothetical protein